MAKTTKHQLPHSTDALVDDLHAEAEALLRDAASDDYSTSTNAIVPMSERKPLWHFVGLWTTFMVGFVYIFTGTTIYEAGYTLPQCIGIMLLGCFVYWLYAIFAAYLGARTGQTHSLLTRSIFGRTGSWVVAGMLIIPPLASTGFQAGLMVQIWNGLYGWHGVEALTIIFSALMVFNNLFGFNGISVFARYVVTPALLLWVSYMVIKGLIDGAHLGAHPKNVSGLTFWQVLGVTIGAGVWGNEPDIWRYSKPRIGWPAIAFGFALGVAGLLFVVAGWMMTSLSGSSDFGRVVNFTTHYSLFGFLLLAFILGSISQIALNDGNYYQAITAIQNLFGGWSRWKRIYSCGIALIIGGVAGYVVNYGSPNGFVLITGLASVTLPCATIIMIVDHFVLPRLLGISRPLLKVPAWTETGFGNVPAIAALIIAVVFGCIATGTIPQDGHRYWGPATPITWVMSAILYVLFTTIARAIAPDSEALKRTMGFSELLNDARLPSHTVVDLASVTQENAQPEAAPRVAEPA